MVGTGNPVAGSIGAGRNILTAMELPALFTIPGCDPVSLTEAPLRVAIPDTH